MNSTFNPAFNASFNPANFAAAFDFSKSQAQATQAAAQASEFAKVFATHATKIASTQQQWIQAQADTLKAQFEQAFASKDLAATAQAAQDNLKPAAQNAVKHAQELYALAQAAQKDLAAKAQGTYAEFATEANTAFEAGIKQLPNAGEPFVSMAKQASQSVQGMFDQVATQLKTAQTNYEAQIDKMFDTALNATTGTAQADVSATKPSAAPAAKAKK